MKYALKFAALGAALLIIAAPAHAAVILPQPVALRVAQSSTVVVGKVESIEEKTVSAKRYANDTEKGEFQIAVIKVSDPILGAKGLTHVRVGFLPPPMPNPGGGPIIRPGGAKPVSFAKDQEVLVFLQPHFDGNFLFAQVFYDVVDKNSPTFEKDVAEAKRCAKLIADPKAGLAAKEQDDRYTTAAMLITQYRTQRPNTTEPKTEAVDAETSKLILTALAEADWKGQSPQGPYMTPQNMFGRLGVTEKDGWKPPMTEVQGRPQIDYAKQPEAMQQWCKDNAGKYKIQRFVYEDKKEEKTDK
jgi:hypothetical protein